VQACPSFSAEAVIFFPWVFPCRRAGPAGFGAAYLQDLSSGDNRSKFRLLPLRCYRVPSSPRSLSLESLAAACFRPRFREALASHFLLPLDTLASFLAKSSKRGFSEFAFFIRATCSPRAHSVPLSFFARGQISSRSARQAASDPF